MRSFRLTTRGLLGMTALFVLLSACGPAAPATPTRPAATPFPTATPAATEPLAPTATPVMSDAQLQALDGATIIVWHVWRGAAGEAFEALAAAFSAADPYGVDLTVTANYQGGISEMPGMLTNGLNAGALPDVAVLMPYQYNLWRKTGGALAPLDAYANDAVIGFLDGADFLPAVWARDVNEGVRWGVPAAMSMQLLAVNLDRVSTTPADATTLAAAVCDGGLLFTPEALALSAWLRANDAGFVTNGDAYLFDTLETERALNTLLEWRQADCLRVPAPFSAVEAFAAGEGALLSTSTSELAAIETAMAARNAAWTVLPFMGSEGGVTTTLYGPSFVALADDEGQQLASWLFLRYVLDNQADFLAAGGFLPVRESQTAALSGYADEHAQWATAVALLPDATVEPAASSWSEVRRALSDAGVALLSGGFEGFELPGLIDALQATADELAAALP